MNYPIADIGEILAAVVAVSLALAGALGPSIMLLTEALKQALTLPNRVGGLLATGVSVVLCIMLALLTALVALDSPSWKDFAALGIVGLLAGILVGSAAIRSHRTAQTIPGPVPAAAVDNPNPAPWPAFLGTDDVDPEEQEFAAMRDQDSHA